MIFTDSESETGIAPACGQPDVHAMHHGGVPWDAWVYDCCEGPHVELWSEDRATAMAALFTEIDAKAAGT